MSELTHYTSGLLGQVFLKDENNDVWAKMWDMDTVTARKRAAIIVEAVNTCTALRAENERLRAQRNGMATGVEILYAELHAALCFLPDDNYNLVVGYVTAARELQEASES